MFELGGGRDLVKKKWFVVGLNWLFLCLKQTDRVNNMADIYRMWYYVISSKTFLLLLFSTVCICLKKINIRKIPEGNYRVISRCQRVLHVGAKVDPPFSGWNKRYIAGQSFGTYHKIVDERNTLGKKTISFNRVRVFIFSHWIPYSDKPCQDY